MVIVGVLADEVHPARGAKGEGVKDKYADPLTGDWSVAKLARYVAANMPEDNPETLTAAIRARPDPLLRLAPSLVSPAEREDFER